MTLPLDIWSKPSRQAPRRLVIVSVTERLTRGLSVNPIAMTLLSRSASVIQRVVGRYEPEQGLLHLAALLEQWALTIDSSDRSRWALEWSFRSQVQVSSSE